MLCCGISYLCIALKIKFLYIQAFEDILILNELMDLYNEDMSQVLPAFSKKRSADAHVICDLAMYNYIEVSI